MRDRSVWPRRWPVAVGLIAVLLVARPAWGQQRASTSPTAANTDTSSKDSSSSAKDAEPVVRTYGGEGGYRTEVTSRTRGKLTAEERRQISLLMAQVFQHLEGARDAVDAEDGSQARKEVQKGLEAIKAIRVMLPKTSVRTRTLAPDGKVLYEDDREVQESRIPLFEGMVHAQTLAPILAARRNALEVPAPRWSSRSRSSRKRSPISTRSRGS